jgi:type IV secretory pathway TraG/TraD family ATPase VirD4
MRDDKPDGRVLFVLDELQNIGPVRSLGNAFAEYNGYGISFIAVLQDFGRLTISYSAHGVESMLSNCEVEILFGGAVSMVERGRRKAGKRNVMAESPSMSEGLPGTVPRLSYGYQRGEMELVTGNHLKRMSRDRHLVFYRGETLWAARRPHYKMPWLRRRWRANPMDGTGKPGPLRRAWYAFADGWLRARERAEDPYKI